MNDFLTLKKFETSSILDEESTEKDRKKARLLFIQSFILAVALAVVQVYI